MTLDLRGRNLLKLEDFTPEEIRGFVDLAKELKMARRAGNEQRQLRGKVIALIFEKASARTRCAFEIAACDQGANVTYLGPTGSHIGVKESVKDRARVVARMYDGIEYCGVAQATAEELARHGVPASCAFKIEMICSSVWRLRFISGPPRGQSTRKFHIAHGSDYGGTVNELRGGSPLCASLVRPAFALRREFRP